MGNKLSGLGTALYNPKRKEFLGRDGAGWGKLGVFYFFFYLGLAGFFCTMLVIFMAMTPRDHPRYFKEDSSMHTRSNRLSPGLGFRPQPDVDKNIIIVNKNLKSEENVFIRNLNHYLQIYYWKTDNVVSKRQGADNDDDDDNDNQKVAAISKYEKFVINNPGDCTSEKQYGFPKGKPCVLVKMNKIVDFKPIPGAAQEDKPAYTAACPHRSDAVSIHCQGEYPADVDNIGNLTYISENGQSNRCGSLHLKWFPYQGKIDRKDFYQAPYIWVQFNNPKPNILINVICRVYGKNIHFDKKTGRALTRFQIYVDQDSQQSKSRQGGEI